MSSRPRSMALVLVAIVAIVVLSVSVPLAAAQQDETGNETAVEDEGRDLVAEVDEDVRVESYDYDEGNETFAITFASVGERPVDVTVTEVIDQRSGDSGRFGVRQFSIAPDETVTIEISARLTRGSAAVMIVTQKSIDDGRGTFLQHETGEAWIQGSPTWWLIRLAAFGGIVGVCALILTVTWHKIADSNDSVAVRT